MSSATFDDRRPAPLGQTKLGRAIVISGVLHAAAFAAVLFWPSEPVPIRPPVYKVNLIGAPVGPKAIGVVDPSPATQPVRQAEAPSGIERPEQEIVAPTPTKAPPKPTPKATPTPTRTAQAGAADGAAKTAASTAPRAGSSTGGRGADVATVRTDGIDFPSPGYLNNIVRQVEVRFSPPSRYENRPLRAEVSFLIHRDGRVTDIRVEQTSGEYAFDLEARSAVEAAGTARAFGALPSEWNDDVLRVYFNFTPKGMR
jgi:periplasmic protein TonB